MAHATSPTVSTVPQAATLTVRYLDHEDIGPIDLVRSVGTCETCEAPDAMGWTDEEITGIHTCDVCLLAQVAERIVRISRVVR